MTDPINQQARQPGGFAGRLMGEVMALFNRTRNRWLLDQLDVRPGMTGLEFGFGNGEVLEGFLARAPDGCAAGLDWSDAMVAAAARRNAAAVASGRLTLRKADIADPASPLGGPYDRIWSSNVIQMIGDRPALFARLRSALTPDGVLATCFQRRRDAPPATELAPQVAAELAAAGYTDVETRWLPGASEPAMCVLARAGG